MVRYIESDRERERDTHTHTERHSETGRDIHIER